VRNARWRVAIGVACVLLPFSAAADVITPLSHVTIPLLPVIVLIEALVFLILARKWLRAAVGFWRVLGVVVVANVATSFVGTLVPLYKYAARNAMLIAFAFAASVLIEWLIYLPFFQRSGLTKRGLLALAVAANLATYVPLAALFTFAPSPAPGPPLRAMPVEPAHAPSPTPPR
jgi:hypothetical protein